MTRRRHPAPGLPRDRRGSTIVEFAIVVPVMILVIMALGDMLYRQYAQSMLAGAVQKAGRDSSLQGTDGSTIDGKVVAMMATMLVTPRQSCPSTTAATWCSTRYAYDTFTEVGPEPFTDGNNDGRCDNGEPYSDVNANGRWDANPGVGGQGGANAVALYTMTMTYQRLFPVARMFGWPATVTISASTLLKNQPYAAQTVTAAVTGNCP
ncbi:TadE/TadG family type IV pilus assembly protein [uncultured Sphingomonas sp.]|uniref:TadE/TadG family type IV pilus assembly protein n=1 Tax=uncultured Sphingomonas sp. TaxID=158754 RepID=UPI00259913FA|nr:TadE/TadG family type IV pilus assembly protein [uncultured Sphingomonas sp.]